MCIALFAAAFPYGVAIKIVTLTMQLCQTHASDQLCKILVLRNASLRLDLAVLG